MDDINLKEESKTVDSEIQKLMMISQQIKPAIDFIYKESNPEKKFQIKIEELPLKIKKIHIEKLIVKLLKGED